MQFKSGYIAGDETRQSLCGGVSRARLGASLSGIFLLAFGFWLLPCWGARAGEIETSSELQPAPAAAPAPPARQRLKPNFSEEERRGFSQRGFKNTFLNDGLNGNSDPLGGGTPGGALEGNQGLSGISAQERGIVPAFDPTDVIIPRSGIR
ncbi:hypothetical protein [Kamptonema formosum]|uniref:hypothetical protein n=1 Tax=Kamptonema formosum TaxID=331992 RepID=UPI00034C9816|nr:hypothetical protein [Oscillatoria sp. PCC 10802]